MPAVSVVSSGRSSTTSKSWVMAPAEGEMVRTVASMASSEAEEMMTCAVSPMER